MMFAIIAMIHSFSIAYPLFAVAQNTNAMNHAQIAEKNPADITPFLNADVKYMLHTAMFTMIKQNNNLILTLL